MAEIEQRESGDEGRAREWMGRALIAAKDPAWTADGIVSDRWMPVSPVTGRLDAFQWRVPLAELGEAREAIDLGQPPAALVRDLPREKEPVAEPVAATIVTPVVTPPAPAPVQIDLPAQPQPAPAAAQDAPVASPRAPRRARPARAEAVIPLVHVPDDPGPEPMPEAEPQLPDDALRRLRSTK